MRVPAAKAIAMAVLTMAMLLVALPTAAPARPGYQGVLNATGEQGFPHSTTMSPGGPTGGSSEPDSTPPGSSNPGSSSGDGGSIASEDASGALPFTGFSLIMLAALGCVVLACGLLLARASRPDR